MRIVVVRGPESAGPFDLSSGPNIIGREPGCTVRLVSKRVSRKHAVAFLADGRLKVSDLGSANGLFDEAGHRADAVLLTPGRKVQVGDFVLRFESDEVGGELDLDDDDPLTADDDLVLEDMDEETPARSGPLPVLRAPESKPARSARPLPSARPAAPVKASPPLAALPPLPAKAERPTQPSVPDPGRLTIDPSLSPIGDTPTAETSARIARPVLPFGPPSGGFGGFMPASSPAKAQPPATPAPATPPPATQPSPPPSLQRTPTVRDFVPPPPLSPFASPSTTGERPKASPSPAPRAIPPVAPAQPASSPPPFRPKPEPLRDELTPLSNPDLPLLTLDPSRSDITPLRPIPFQKEDPPTVSDAGPPPPRAMRPSGDSGIGWLIQVGGILAVVACILVCGPFGGFFSLIYGGHQDALALSLLRGEVLTESLGNRNAAAVAEGRGIALETSFLLQDAGVNEAMVADAAGTVLAPPERLRRNIAGSAAFAAASAAHDVASVENDDGSYEIVAPIRGEMTPGSGVRSIVGWAWVRYDPSVAAGTAASPWLSVLASLFYMGAATGVLLFGGYWLFVRPLRALREETELAVTGSVDQVEPIVRFGPLDDLAHSINRAVQRSRR